MKKPVIGVLPLWDGEKESIWMLPGYTEGIRLGGGIGVILPLWTDKQDVAQLSSLCDGFLFTGGHDIAPALYREEKRPCCEELCPERDKLEMELFEEGLRLDKPMLGICRGLQLFNGALGGTLYQDLSVDRPGMEKEFHSQVRPYEVPSHRVTVTRGSLLHTILGEETIWVNSLHHQAISVLSPRLTACAESEDGIIEAAYMSKKKFVMGVQWHPECSYKTDLSSKKIFSAFVAACH